jgi:hypothetical protein
MSALAQTPSKVEYADNEIYVGSQVLGPYRAHENDALKAPAFKAYSLLCTQKKDEYIAGKIHSNTQFSDPELMITDITGSTINVASPQSGTCVNGECYINFNFVCKINLVNSNPAFRFKKSFYNIDGASCPTAQSTVKKFLIDSHLTNMLIISSGSTYSYSRRESRRIGYTGGCTIAVYQIERY